LHKILIADRIHDEGINILRNEGFFVDVRAGITRDELLNIINQYDAIIVRSRTKVDREIIERGTKLKVIARAGVGIDNIDVNAAKEKGIVVINSPEGPSRSVAELVIAFIFSLLREIPHADASMKEGKWIKKELIGHEIKDKVLGIIGFGRIGQEVAKLAKALGMKVLAYDVIDIGPYCKRVGASQVDINYLLSDADIITLHIPLTDKTRGIINKDFIKKMKKGVYLINTARGGIIDNEALLWGLEQGYFSGVALDVFSEEPPKSEILQKIVKHPKVICTPHIGANTEEALRNNSLIVAQKIIKLLKA